MGGHPKEGHTNTYGPTHEQATLEDDAHSFVIPGTVCLQGDKGEQKRTGGGESEG